MRELRNIIESAFNIEKKEYISLESVDALFRRTQLVKTVSREERNVSQRADLLSEAAAIEPGMHVDLEQMLAAYERQLIQTVMEQETKLIDVAERLSISPQKLQYRLKKLGIANKKF